ncbi:GDP-D-glucose phosphorylase 1 [Hyalella azteca]|uniref:GDP-D-glucose phosphorylase 1 n=1 Tax=Hyalella azteca TaxID=294128 RepID=A0A8B7NHZ5_HYAAZ|nr:GDP-D-glucose phosphorylase 1 [Hyalella azteca]
MKDSKSDSFNGFWTLPAVKFTNKDFIHYAHNESTTMSIVPCSSRDSAALPEQLLPSSLQNIEVSTRNYGGRPDAQCLELLQSVGKSSKCNEEEEITKQTLSKLDRFLMTKWKAASEVGALNYSVANVLTKILPGKYCIVAQLNPARAMQRRKPQSFTKLHEPFNPDLFNFTKIKSSELLFNIHLVLENNEDLSGSIIVNAAPICSTHSLLLPSVQSCLPQLIDRDGLMLAVSTVLLSSSPSFRVGFNSLCAYASVNHHHYHCYFLPQHLYVESAACRPVRGRCHVFIDHYAPGFVFQVDPNCLIESVGAAMKLLSWMISADIPHNVFITRGQSLDDSRGPDVEDAKDDSELEACAAATGSAEKTYQVIRICIWAREASTGAKDVSVFAPALCELAGHVPIYNADYWDRINEEYITKEIHSLCKDAFDFVLANIESIL